MLDARKPLQRSDAAAEISNPGNPVVLINASIWPMAAVSTVFLGLRLYCKAFRIRWMVWLDDWLLLAGWAFLVASQTLLSELMRLGFARSYLVTPAMSTVLYLSDNFHKISLALTKTSFAVTLLRIASGWQKVLIWFLVGSINVQFVVHVILTWREICPVTPGDTTPHLPVSCWDAKSATTLGIFGGFYSAASDFVLALLPWKIVIGLQMKSHEKIGVAVAMSMGVLAGTMGIMKAVYSIIMLDLSTPNYFWQVCIFWVWAMAEPNVTIVAASIPVLRVLFRNMRSQKSLAYPSSGAYIRSDNLSKFQNKSMSARASMAAGAGVQVNDDDSDRSILPRPRGILRVTEVSGSCDRSSRQLDKSTLTPDEDGIELESR